ncbi:histidine kinase [Actinoplanes sp. NBRC 14428]|nr:histidine kinase [Actinoplanes sp. NBRC 14428]
MKVRTAQEALAQRPLTFLRSSWPWRSLAYLLSAIVLEAGVLAVILAPVLLGNLNGVHPAASVTAGVLLLGLAGPAVARAERRRLRLVDREPLPAPHRPAPAANPAARLRALLREPATWREVGFAAVCSLALCLVDGALIALGAYLIVLPVLALAAAGALVTVLLLPVYAYVVTGWAGVRAAITRAVLAPRDAELGEQLIALSQSRVRLVDAFEVERRRIERDLHDGAQQRLVALTMTLGLARLDVADDSPLAAQLDTAHRQATEALTELQELIRGVHPEVLTGRGLPAAVEDVAGRSALPVEIDVRLPRRLTASVEATAYFVVCETLANASRHAGATSAAVRIGLENDLLVVEVSDDGHGGADPGRGSGLSGLLDRVAVLDGRLLLSSPPGGPTVVRVEIPCTQTVRSA